MMEAGEPLEALLEVADSVHKTQEQESPEIEKNTFHKSIHLFCPFARKGDPLEIGHHVGNICLYIIVKFQRNCILHRCYQPVGSCIVNR